MSTRRSSAWRLFPALAVLALLALALSGLSERWSGPDLPFRLRRLQVVPHDPAGPSLAPLRAGDRLIAVNGRILRRDGSALGALAGALRQGPAWVQVERGGVRQELRLRRQAPEPVRRLGWTLRTLAAALIFLTGYWVQWRRRDPLARLFFVLTLLIGSLLALDPRLGPGLPARLLEWKGDLFALMLPPVWLHFIVLFPERRARPLWLRLLVFLPPVALGLLVGVAILQDLPMTRPSSPARELQTVGNLLSLLLLLLGLGVLVLKAFRRKYRREQRRLRLVLLAATLGLLPLVAFHLLHLLLPGRRLGLADWTPLFLTLLPVSFALGMLGPDLPALQRRATLLRRYLLSGALLLLLFGALRLALHALRPEHEGLGEAVFLDVLALVLAMPLHPPLLRRLNQRDRRVDGNPFVDCLRWLAPPRYFTDRPEMSRALLPRLGWDADAAWALWLERESPNRWQVRERWQREGGPAHSITVPEPGVAMTLPAGLERSLLGKRFFLAAEQWDPYWARSLLGEEALPYCKARDWALLLCLAADSEQPALLVLGPACSSGLYDANVVEGLQTLVAPLELHLRNLALLARAARDEQLRSEMDLARKIQLSLLPRNTPSLGGVELAGRMRTSSDVGGDYYDYLELDGRRLGLALGDATGHGVPAAMLISSVALAFHTQAAEGQRPATVLGAMSQSLGRLITDRSRSRGAFAGFFYALLDRDTSLLRFCNAGMPSPWLLRGSGRLERLQRGGQLLGVNDGRPYLQGTLRIHPGDLLFLRSDGLEEQQDAHAVPYGESRLADWLRSRKDLPLEALSDQLLEELDRFGGGVLHDDISFVFMRLSA
ncbi:MAG: SpoIIE family protein phosphatase [Candidatus Krumholzibacteriia bacterium]|nr:SpoIIE family protein phosphatase [bacterium]MCB9515120.1 SpoIIE family protein phosphatase [Candidatus Latescibacterota bacterium]